MDPGSLSLSVRAVIVCLLGAARCSSADKSSCSCSEIPVLPLTDPPPENCSRNTFRYTCIDGYLRKAGTSNLIKCSGSNSAAKWTTATLRCIPDPRRTTTRPPKSPVTTASFTNLQMTKSGSFSSTGLLEKNSLEPTSLSVQVDHSQATDRTTPASSNQPPNNRTDSPPLSGHTDHRLGTTTTALIVCASLVIVCALIGISYVCYRRKSQRNDRPATDEETISMNNVPAEPAS